MSLKGALRKIAASALAGTSALAAGAAVAAPPLKQVPLPRPRPPIVGSAPANASPGAGFRTASLTPAASAIPKEESGLPFSSAISVSKPDLDAVKQVIDLARHGKTQEASDA